MSDLMLLGDSLCNTCIVLMEEMSKMFGISYGTLNILLFVILGPLSTTLFASSTIILLVNKKNSKKLRVVAIVLAIMGGLIVLSVLFPIFYVFFNSSKISGLLI